jgi:hypothetical protein
LERWLDRVERILGSLARLGIEERQIALTARYTAIIVEAMTLFAGSLGHVVADPETRTAVVAALTEANDNVSMRERVLQR